jgi:RNA polymerase sigma-70 factor (ECF subfamily)
VRAVPADRVTPVGGHDRWELLLPHRDRLMGLVRSRLRDRHDVEDCVQETLLRAAAFPTLNTQYVGGFLTTTALRLCVDHYRDNDRRRRLHLRLSFTEHIPGPEDTACDSAVGLWLLDEVKQLSGREREVLLARANGMSTAEAARRLRISRKAAESAFTRGRARLRARYDDSLAETT